MNLYIVKKSNSCFLKGARARLSHMKNVHTEDIMIMFYFWAKAAIMYLYHANQNAITKWHIYTCLVLSQNKQNDF